MVTTTAAAAVGEGDLFSWEREEEIWSYPNFIRKRRREDLTTYVSSICYERVKWGIQVMGGTI
jgi:hypothetical protein